MKKNTKNLIEELADVMVLADQFLLMYPSLYKQLTEIKHKKAQRTIERIHAEK